MFGIVLTMLLAVYERRRETGLLRAVGMTRAQVRTTVRWESVFTSVYGAVVGVVIGLVLGYVVIVALRDQGLTKYSVPVSTIVAIILIAFVRRCRRRRHPGVEGHETRHPAGDRHRMTPMKDLSAEMLSFLRERHMATLTTLRADGSPHVVPVGFSYDAEVGVVRIITFAKSVKARNAARHSRAAVSQVDGGRWATLEGVSRLVDDPPAVALAVAGYAARYRQPGERADRVAIEITVDKVMGRADGGILGYSVAEEARHRRRGRVRGRRRTRGLCRHAGRLRRCGVAEVVAGAARCRRCVLHVASEAGGVRGRS